MHPETPEQGRTLEELFAGSGMDIPQMLTHLELTASQLGLPFGRRTMTYNSRRAQELGKWAEDQGQGDRFHDKAFEAYFAHGQNIAQLHVLRDLAVSVGLDGDAAQKVLENEVYTSAVDKDWQRARQMGIHAVPTLHLDGRIQVGAQSYEALEAFVRG